MKRGLYAVYGSNAAAIFTSWQLVLENKHEFFGFKNKKCKNAEEAADYIARNLAFDYEVMDFECVDKSLLISNIDSIFSISELKK